MSAPSRQLRRKQTGGVSSPLLALVYAQNVFAAIDRRMPEGRADRLADRNCYSLRS